MYMMGAIYFKAPWTFQFDPSDTRSEPFRLDDRSTRTTDSRLWTRRTGAARSG